MNPIHAVKHHRIIFKGQEAVGHSRRNVQRLAMQASHLEGHVPPECGRASPEVQEYIQYCSLETAYKLGTCGWGNLKVHSPDHTLSRDGNKYLLGAELNPFLLEYRFVEDFEEVATPVLVNRRLDDEDARESGGMQIHNGLGSWKDCFPVQFKTKPRMVFAMKLSISPVSPG